MSFIANLNVVRHRAFAFRLKQIDLHKVQNWQREYAKFRFAKSCLKEVQMLKLNQANAKNLRNPCCALENEQSQSA